MFIIAFFSYRCVKLGLNIGNLIEVTMLTIIFVTPLTKIILLDKPSDFS
ncbi:MAG: hypothetical protein KIC47_11230 [Clostridium sp.]|nr:hypothetical protein [Clostridium sp.]